MTEQEYLAICKSQYAEITKLKEVTDFYQYEKQFSDIMQDLNRRVFENSISTFSTDRRKKKRSASTEQ